MSKKTIAVEDVKQMINDFLLNSADSRRDSRIDMSNLLEAILMSTKNYKGFNYLTTKDMLQSWDGGTVGMNTAEDGAFLEDYDARFLNTDNTRVHYF